MPPTFEWPEKFGKEVHCLQEESVFTPGTASVEDHMKNGHGNLTEGITTQMKIGDLQWLAGPDDCPEESSVQADYEHFYKDHEMAPLVALLPTITVSGTADTKAGDWKVLYEPNKSRLWAFLRFLGKMKHSGLMGNEEHEERYKQIVADLLPRLHVIIVKLQEEDELWAEWNRSNQAGHVELQHSLERVSNRFKFFSRLKLAIKKQLKEAGQPTDVQMKQLFNAYINAENNKKFTKTKGMTGVKRENELGSLMKWGDFTTKIGEMESWKALEVLDEGKTQFFTTIFGSSFCKIVEDDADIAKYVLHALTACIKDKDSEEKWRKKVMDASVEQTKGIVKTLVLQYKWSRYLVDKCKSMPIMSAELQKNNFQLIETCFSWKDAEEFMADSTGKKANLHPLALELCETCNKVLWKLTCFSTFRSAQAAGQNFQHTIKQEALQKLCVENILDPWKDHQTQFEGKEKKVKGLAADQLDEEEEENEAGQVPVQLPTWEEAIKDAAKNELGLYLSISFVRTGDIALDRAKMFSSDLMKPRTDESAPWNSVTRGNRRVFIYDEAGRRNPRWKYIKGRNEYRCKVSFQKDDFEMFADIWEMTAKPGEGNVKEKIDVIMVWNAEQEKASTVILKKLKSMKGMEGKQVKKTVLRGQQAHVERRLWETTPEGEVGDLAGLPGMQEELFEGYAGPVPACRDHILKMGPIKSNAFPEEIIPLRDPKKSQPLVSVEVQKMIFPPDDDKPHDGENVVRNDEVWAPCHVCSRLRHCYF